MKKNLTIFIVLILVLSLCLVGLVGCGKVKDETVSETAAIWAETENKESTDTIKIYNFNISELFKINNVKITINKKFEKGVTTISFTINELSVSFLNNDVLSFICGQLPIEIEYAELKSIINNFDYAKGDLVLTENNTKLTYNIQVKVNYKTEIYSKTISGDTVIDTEVGYGAVISQSMDLLLGHISSIFEPTKDETAIFNTTKIKNIVREAINYQETNDPNKDTEGYEKLSTKINKIFGVTHWSQIFDQKIKINTSSSECKVKKGFITSMNVNYGKIQFMYNKQQLSEVLTKAIAMLSPGTEISSGLIGLILNETTKGESCIEIEKININSTYQLNK